MSGVATMHPQPALPPRLGSAHRGSSGERAETVTAGITDWAPAGLLRAQGQPGLGRGPGLPEPFRAPRAAGGHRCPAGPNGHDVAPTPSAEGWPSYSRGRESPPELARGTSIPELNIRPLTWPQPVRPGESPKKGVRPRNPRLGGRSNDSRFLTPGRAQRAAGKWPTAHAPVWRACFRQWQLRCPSRCHLVPASPPDQSRPRPPSSDC